MIDRGRHSVLGVMVDAIDLETATERVVAAARKQRPLALAALAVHGVMTGVQDRDHNALLNSLDVVAPDGQPVRWALNLLHGTRLPERVYGPELTLRVVDALADEGLPVYLYGSTPETLERFSAALRADRPRLRIAGAEPSRFRALRPGEDEQIAERIAASGARCVLVGLGCPRQEVFVAGMRPLLSMPLLAVGAAFDYHAGLLRRPPAWMQRRGLEWLWRLGLEPRRLWRRYLLLNPHYLARLAAQRLRLWRAAPPAPATTRPSGFDG